MRWPPFHHVIFDCDSTLTRVEGIDVLAANAGRAEEVARLTRAAMDGEIDLDAVYGERLAAINPSRAEIASLRRVYKEEVVPDAAPVIAALGELGHDVYVVSGGLLEPVREFGMALGVPAEHIRAVGVEYDQLVGEWWSRRGGEERYLDYGKGALAVSAGKAQIIAELTGGRAGRRLLVGDGTSDLLAAKAVDLFVGFGAVAVRPAVEQGAPVFLTALSLSPILPLAAGPSAHTQLGDPEQRKLFATGVELAEAARWNDRARARRFSSAVAAAR